MQSPNVIEFEEDENEEIFAQEESNDVTGVAAAPVTPERVVPAAPVTPERVVAPSQEPSPEPQPILPQQDDHNLDNDPRTNDDLDTSPAPKKRKRKFGSTTHTPKVKKKGDNDDDDDDDEDDGLTCPICLDHWEMSGDHRLCSLKCGHLFGNSCILRWLVESAHNGTRCCPQCKAKASKKDIRHLYAKRVRAVDRTEEHRLREQLDRERENTTRTQTELATLKMSYTMILQEVQKLAGDNERLKNSLRQGGSCTDLDSNISQTADLSQLPSYRLFMEKNIEIAKEPGCRVMIFSENFLNMLVSQKSCQNLFPGYGVRFLNTTTFRPTVFLHVSAKPVRDICLSFDQTLLAAASMEPRVKLFDTRSRNMVSMFTPSDKPIWACSLDRDSRDNIFYAGTQHGSTYSYDIRFPETVVEEYRTDGDLSPVINITPVPGSEHFPSGGFLVCKLQSLWFYQYTSDSHAALGFRLNVEGPFISVSYNLSTENILVFARSSSRYPQSRYILGRLSKIEDVPVFHVKVTFFGSKVTPVMSRCSQIAMKNNTLVAGYIQDAKLLSLFDMNRRQRLQSMPVQEVVYDTCAVYTQNSTYLAALTETKCRIYKVTSSDNCR